MPERRRLDRRTFSYYMRLMNEKTGELIGHLADISTGGFKMESQKPIPSNVDFRFRIDLTSDVANVPYLVFNARSKWCQRDHIDTSSFNVGFELIDMNKADVEIFTQMFEKYGSKSNKGSEQDYLWR